MAQEHDEFDIVPDEEGSTFSRSGWLWMAVIAIVAIFAFAVGAAYVVVSERLNGSVADPSPPIVNEPQTTASASITQTASLTSTVTPTVTTTPTTTVTPTTTPSPTPTVFCSQQVEEVFRPLYNEGILGCAESQSTIVWSAWQPFERGAMLWRSDTDRSYVFYDSGEWGPIDISWGGETPSSRGTPPPGLQAPERGFGFVWGNSDELFNRLGWATDQERGFCALVQRYTDGFILRSSNVASCTPDELYNHATAAEWSPVLLAAPVGRAWYNVPPPESSADVGGERPAGTSSRPAAQGIYSAPRLDGITLDATFTDWPESWQPINALILGLDRHTGPGDLSANFQMGWNRNGLLFAVRVNDDRYVVSPQGTNQWQGDGFEIQFDRDLVGDFYRTTADEDDIQLGLAFNENFAGMRGYQWLPFDREASLTLPGTVRGTDRGYQVEFIVPWFVLGLSEDEVSTNIAYGFNFSINDNDSDAPAQETVLSFSPARTTHDNPTEWSTLILLP